MSGEEHGRVRPAAALVTAAVYLAAALLTAGLGLYLVRGGAAQPFQVHSVLQLFTHAARSIAAGAPRGFIEAGLIVLLLGPFLRLAAAVLRCGRGPDWRYAAIGAVVAALMLAGIVLGTGS